MSRAVWIAMIALVLAATVGVIAYYLGVAAPLTTPDISTAPVADSAVAEPAAPATAEPAAEPPSPPTVDASLPALTDSDALARRSAEALFGASRLTLLLVPQHLIQRFVLTVDSLDGAPVPVRERPLRHAEGLPQITASDSALIWSPDNARRYTPYVRLLQAANVQQLVDTYFRLYPLLQAAYVELGYQDRSFNTRLIAVIDHLLATPVLATPIELVRPKVLYEFADPSLEALSSGQKIMLRIGNDNALVVSARLRQIRAAILARAAAQPPG